MLHQLANQTYNTASTAARVKVRQRLLPVIKIYARQFKLVTVLTVRMS